MPRHWSGVESGLVELVKSDADVSLLLLIFDDLQLLVVVEVAQLHQLKHDSLLGVLELLVHLKCAVLQVWLMKKI